MSTLLLRPGDSLGKDPADQIVVGFDWDTENLAVTVSIVTSSWTIATYRPTGATLPTLDQSSIVSGNRSTQVRVSGGTAGATYLLTNTITTDEGPAQTKERSIYIQVRQR